MYGKIKTDIQERLENLRAQGLVQGGKGSVQSQGTSIRVQLANGKERTALNFCANNYLALANRDELRQGACRAMEEWGTDFLLCGLSAGPRGPIKFWNRRSPTF